MYSRENSRGSGRLVLALLLACLVAACTKVPLGSLWQLRQFDFETFDPAVLRVAMHLPAAYGMSREAVRIDLKVKRAEDATEYSLRVVMHESRDKADLVGLPMATSPDGRWVVLRLDPAEVERVRAFRAKLMAMKAASSGKGKGSLSLGASPRLCRTGAAASGTPRAMAAMLWTHDKGYVTILRESELDELVNAIDDAIKLSELPPC